MTLTKKCRKAIRPILKALAVGGCVLIWVLPALAWRGGGYGSGRGYGSHWGARGYVHTPICEVGALEDQPHDAYRILKWDGALVGLPGFWCVGPIPVQPDHPINGSQEGADDAGRSSSGRGI
jgi:hypothetical protein